MDNQKYKTNRHSCYLLQYHLVVVTKYRRPAINDDIKKYLIDLTNQLFETNWKCSVISVNTDKDHIHILFEAPPQVQLSVLVNNYKTVTSRMIQKHFKDLLSQHYRKPVFWSQSYFICSVSDRTEEIIKKYIENQSKD